MNKCGECNMCCFVPEIKALKKKANTLCENYCPLKRHCKKYDERPDECRQFKCVWLQMKKVSLDLRPDKCKMMFEKLSDRLFYGTQDLSFEITKVAKKQIEQFNLQGFSVVVNDKGKMMFSLAKGHNINEIKNDYDNYIRIKHGSTQLYN